MEKDLGTSKSDTQPPFFSLAFHLRFFPRVIRRIIFPGKNPDNPFSGRGSGFSSTPEHMALFAAAIISLAAGLPAALAGGSLIGWFFAVAGAAGAIALLAASIASRKGCRPVYDDFRILIFLFCIFLGITCSLALGHSFRSSYPARVMLAAAGMAGGYISGIFAGLWAQRLGWIAGLLDLLAGLCVISLIIIDIILLM